MLERCEKRAYQSAGTRYCRDGYAQQMLELAAIDIGFC